MCLIVFQMNTETKKLMETPRCGCSDISDTMTSSERFQRYSIHNYGGWPKIDLTYTIINASSSLERNVSDNILRKALSEWSNVTPLTFTEVVRNADLDIFFVSRDHADGYAFDGYGGVLAHAFFPYYGGDVHFDDDEHWTINEAGDGTDLFLVAVHEFGHSLGLKHSSVTDAIMYPFYSYRDSFELHEDDIAGIQNLYGIQGKYTTGPMSSSTPTESGTGPTTTTPTSTITIRDTSSTSGSVTQTYTKHTEPATSASASTTESWTTSTENTTPGISPFTSSLPTTRPVTETPTKSTSTLSPPTTTRDSSCAFSDLDAITSDKSGDIFVFHGETYTLIDHKGIVEGFPRNISTDFPEISGKVDAVVYLPELIRNKCLTNNNGMTQCYEIIRPEEVFLFSGPIYHRYVGGYLESKRKKDTGLISDEFQGLPSGISVDAVFTYDGTDVYFVSGDMLWKQSRGNRRVDSCYPQSLRASLFSGLQNSEMQINDVLSLPTTSTYYNYFFVGDFYFRTSDGATSFDPAQYPRDIAEWWCRNNLKNDLGYFKHHSVYIQTNGDRILVPRKIEL